MLNRILRRGIREISKVIASPEVGYPILIDYPVTPKVRQGWRKPPHREIDALLKKHEGNFRHLLEEGRKLGPWLDKIDSASQGLEPFWSNIWFTGLDAMALYTMLATNKPAQLIEIGSGNSTKFARRAIKDHALPTRIISIDPQPRAEIDALCDEFVRAPLEDSVDNLAQRLKAGDILFFDGSHRSFQNSDVTVFFLEVLPRLAAGVIVHIHDIFLPNDYPEQWAARYYSEQYVLAAWLLGGGAGSEILFASAYVGLSETLRQPVELLAGAAYPRGLTHNLHATGGAKGVSFWLKSVLARPSGASRIGRRGLSRDRRSHSLRIAAVLKPPGGHSFRRQSSSRHINRRSQLSWTFHCRQTSLTCRRAWATL